MRAPRLDGRAPALPEPPLSSPARRMRDLLAALPLPVADDAPAPPPAPGGSVAARLLAAGFPRRHVERLSQGLHGASLDKARELWPRLARGDALLILAGDRGPGKTQMATWWAARWIEEGRPPGRYVKCADLIGGIKATWRDGGRHASTAEEVLRRYRRAPYLVIDEFHERGGSDWECRCLVNLLDHRYDDMLATVLIVNTAAEKVGEGIHPGILSRARETGGLVVCGWAGYR